MPSIAIDDLRQDAFYWARKASDEAFEIVQVSAVFGTAREFLTAAVIGTDAHLNLEEFEFYEEILPPGLTSDIARGDELATA